MVFFATFVDVIILVTTTTCAVGIHLGPAKDLYVKECPQGQGICAANAHRCPKALSSCWNGCSREDLFLEQPALQSLYANFPSQKVPSMRKLAVVLRGQAFRRIHQDKSAEQNIGICEGDPTDQFNAVSNHIRQLQKLSYMGYNVDVFMSTMPCRNRSNTFVHDVAAMYGDSLKKVDVHEPLPNQYASYRRAIDMLSQYMTSHQIAYDYLLVQRFDMLSRVEEIPVCLFDQAALELHTEDFAQFIPAKSIPCFVNTVQAGLWEFQPSPASVSYLNYCSLKDDAARHKNDNLSPIIQAYDQYFQDICSVNCSEPPGQMQAASCLKQLRQ